MMTINCKGKLVDVSQPLVMGILNCTPDSFYDGNVYVTEKEWLVQVEKMIGEGAAFIDVGAYSSRPNAVDISEEEELKRLLPVVTSIRRWFPDTLLSIDTFRSRVADLCLQMGVALINDISAGSMDSAMMEVVARHRAPYVMMHLKGTPQTMRQQARYEDVVKEILYYFSVKIAEARKAGINDLVIDPGFGFSKTTAHNYEILNKLEVFQSLELPVLAGISRKSMIYKLLNTSPQNALNGTTCLHTIALLKGAHILRVHDVREAMECIQLVGALNAQGGV
jgi:dihydropteroate synthase